MLIPISITSKGQAFLPKSVRDQTGIKAGTRAFVSIVNGKAVIEPAPTLEEIQSYFKKPKGFKPPTKTEQKKTVFDAVVEKFRKKGFSSKT